MYYCSLLRSLQPFLLTATFVSLIAFLLRNWLFNSYSKQNKRLSQITNKLISYPTQANTIMENAPYCYQVQWNIYKRSGASKPAVIFQFYKHFFAVKGWGLAIAPFVVSVVYFVAFCIDTQLIQYLLLLCFTALFVFSVVIVSLFLFTMRTRKAQRVFAEFLLELNKAIPINRTPTCDTVSRLNNLQRLEPTPSVMKRAAEILQQRGINSNRTVDEQRKINLALNGLLQAYASKISNS